MRMASPFPKEIFSTTPCPFSSKPSTNSTQCLSLLERCSDMKQLKQIHAHTIAHGLSRYTYTASRILAFCAVHNNGDMAHARQLFDRIPSPTVFNWNTMIKGYSKSPEPEMGLAVYTRMRRQRVDPNMHTFPAVIRSCVHLSLLAQTHGQVFRLGFDSDVYVTSSMIKGYSNCGGIELASKVFDESWNRNIVCRTSLISAYCSHGLMAHARELFDRMPERNEVSWSAMIAGYVQNECYEDAIQLFRDLRNCVSAKLNDSLLVSVLSACAVSGASEEGKWVHSYIDEKGIEYNLMLGTALVDFYAKCGCIERAREVFSSMPSKDVTAWSAMIMGLALNGQSNSAIEAFGEMLRNGVKPNTITFVGVLTACNHGGLVDEGQAYFESMSKIYGVSPTLEHYGCMVDLLSRAGRTSEAERLIWSMPMEPDGAIWGALLNGCVVHGHVELGERVGRHVIELEPQHCGRYVGLANVYASKGKWETAVNVRRVMRERGVMAEPGWSLIEMDGVGHRFLADDRTHPQLEEITRILSNLSKEFVHRQSARQS